MAHLASLKGRKHPIDMSSRRLSTEWHVQCRKPTGSGGLMWQKIKGSEGNRSFATGFMMAHHELQPDIELHLVDPDGWIYEILQASPKKP